MGFIVEKGEVKMGFFSKIRNRNAFLSSGMVPFHKKSILIEEYLPRNEEERAKVASIINEIGTKVLKLEEILNYDTEIGKKCEIIIEQIYNVYHSLEDCSKNMKQEMIFVKQVLGLKSLIYNIQKSSDQTFVEEHLPYYENQLKELLDCNSLERIAELKFESAMLIYQLDYYQAQLKNLNREIELQLVALMQAYENKVYNKISMKTIYNFSFDTLGQIWNRKSRMEELIQRVSICKTVVDGCYEVSQKIKINRQSLLDEINLYHYSIESLELDAQDNIKTVINNKIDELFEMAYSLGVTSNHPVPEHQTDRIKWLAGLRVKMDLYVYEHRKDIEKFKNEIRSFQPTKINKKTLDLIKEYENIYKAFGRYITDDDWLELYRKKFDLLLCNINERKFSPFHDLDDFEKKYYIRVLEEKVLKLINGDNQVLDWLVRNHKKQKTAIMIALKRILKNGVRFNYEKMLEDRDRLSIIHAFEKEDGIYYMTLSRDKLLHLTDKIGWNSLVPAEGISALSSMDIQEKEIYGTIKWKEIKDLFQSLSFLFSNYNIKNYKYYIPLGVNSIGDDVFTNRDDLVRLYFSDTVRSIGKRAFMNCNCLEYVDLNEGLEHLGGNAFYHCKKLDYLITPKTIKSWESDLFGYPFKDKEVYYHGGWFQYKPKPKHDEREKQLEYIRFRSFGYRLY